MQGCSKRYGSDLERTEGKLIEDVEPLNGRRVSGTGDGLSCVKWWMLFSMRPFHLRPMASLCCETGTDSLLSPQHIVPPGRVSLLPILEGFRGRHRYILFGLYPHPLIPRFASETP